MKRITLALLALSVTVVPTFAGDYEASMRSYLKDQISAWVDNPVILSAVQSQNLKSIAYSQSQIDEMDLDWRAQVGAGNSPIIDPVLNNATSDFLREQVLASDGLITEIFVMDARGLNVAASDVTSDMWQGDEAKFTQTFLVGASAAHFSEVEFDESSEQYQGQISMTIVDASSGEPIGAITVGVDPEALP